MESAGYRRTADFDMIERQHFQMFLENRVLTLCLHQ